MELQAGSFLEVLYEEQIGRQLSSHPTQPGHHTSPTSRKQEAWPKEDELEKTKYLVTWSMPEIHLSFIDYQLFFVKPYVTSQHIQC